MVAAKMAGASHAMGLKADFVDADRTEQSPRLRPVPQVCGRDEANQPVLHRHRRRRRIAHRLRCAARGDRRWHAVDATSSSAPTSSCIRKQTSMVTQLSPGLVGVRDDDTQSSRISSAARQNNRTTEAWRCCAACARVPARPWVAVGREGRRRMSSHQGGRVLYPACPPSPDTRNEKRYGRLRAASVP